MQQGDEDIDALLAELGEAPPASSLPGPAAQDNPSTSALTQSMEAAVEAAEDAGLTPRGAEDEDGAAGNEEGADGKVGGLLLLTILQGTAVHGVSP